MRRVSPKQKAACIKRARKGQGAWRTPRHARASVAAALAGQPVVRARAAQLRRVRAAQLRRALDRPMSESEIRRALERAMITDATRRAFSVIPKRPTVFGW